MLPFFETLPQTMDYTVVQVRADMVEDAEAGAGALAAAPGQAEDGATVIGKRVRTAPIIRTVVITTSTREVAVASRNSAVGTSQVRRTRGSRSGDFLPARRHDSKYK